RGAALNFNPPNGTAAQHIIPANTPTRPPATLPGVPASPDQIANAAQAIGQLRITGGYQVRAITDAATGEVTLAVVPHVGSTVQYGQVSVTRHDESELIVVRLGSNRYVEPQINLAGMNPGRVLSGMPRHMGGPTGPMSPMALRGPMM